MTKFYKFNEYIVVDRAVGMIHVYSRNNVEPGRFAYIRMGNLEKLYRDWRFKKQRNHFKYAERFIRGTFPDVLNPHYKNNVLSEFDIKDYEKRKDDAIKAIGKEKNNVISATIKKDIILKYGIAMMPGIKQEDKAKALHLTRTAISHWKEFKEKYPEILKDY